MFNSKQVSLARCGAFDNTASVFCGGAARCGALGSSAIVFHGGAVE